MCNVNQARLQPAADNIVPQVLPLAILEVVLSRLRRTGSPSALKPPNCLRCQYLLGLRFRQRNCRCNSFQPCIRHRSTMSVLRIFGFLFGLHQNLLPKRVSLDVLLPLPPISIGNRRVENQVPTRKCCTQPESLLPGKRQISPCRKGM